MPALCLEAFQEFLRAPGPSRASKFHELLLRRRTRSFTGKAGHLLGAVRGHRACPFEAAYSHTTGEGKCPCTTVSFRLAQSKQYMQLRRLQFYWLVLNFDTAPQKMVH